MNISFAEKKQRLRKLPCSSPRHLKIMSFLFWLPKASIRDIAKALGVRPQFVTQYLEDLRRHGWIKRNGEKYSYVYSATEKGQKMLIHYLMLYHIEEIASLIRASIIFLMQASESEINV